MVKPTEVAFTKPTKEISIYYVNRKKYICRLKKRIMWELYKRRHNIYYIRVVF